MTQFLGPRRTVMSLRVTEMPPPCTGEKFAARGFHEVTAAGRDVDSQSDQSVTTSA